MVRAPASPVRKSSGILGKDFVVNLALSLSHVLHPKPFHAT